MESIVTNVNNITGNRDLGQRRTAIIGHGADLTDTFGDLILAADIHCRKQDDGTGSIKDVIVLGAEVGTTLLHLQSGQFCKLIDHLKIHLRQAGRKTQGRNIGSTVKRFGINFQVIGTFACKLNCLQFLATIKRSSGDGMNTDTNR